MNREIDESADQQPTVSATLYVLRNAVNDFLGYASDELVCALVVDNILEALEPTFVVHKSAILFLLLVAHKRQRLPFCRDRRG